MKLPPDYLDVIAQGSGVLRALSTRVRAIAARTPEASAPWILARGIESLVDRLESVRPEDWQTGSVDFFIHGTDVGMLDECLMDTSIGARTWADTLSTCERAQLTRLRGFLSELLDELWGDSRMTV